MRKIITGGKGFIGSNLIGDIHMTRQDSDLTNYKSILNFLNFYKPETVIHCAAKHGSVLEMNKNHVEYVDNNICCDLNIIKACKESGVENLLMISSITSFPKNCSYPLKEENFEGEVNDNFFGYAYSKKISIGLCHAYQKEYNLNYKSVFLGNVYGPHNKFNENSTAVANLIFKFIKAKEEKNNLNLFGDGKAVRNYIYVKDLNFIFDKIIEDKNLKNPVIVSSEQETSIKDIVDIIKKEIKFDNKIIFDANNIIGDQVKISDISNLKKVIGDFKFTDIETGIKETIDWYLLCKNNIVV